MSPLLYLLVILGCILLSGFFSSSETALLRLRPEELESDIEAAKGPSALATRDLLKNSSRLLITILLGNNVVNILGASCASALAIYYLGDKGGLVISTVVMTIIVLVFSEILPKAIAARNPKRMSYTVSLPLYLIHRSLWPIHLLFEKLIDPLVRKFAGSEAESSDSSEELLRLARQVRQHRWDGSRPLSIIAAAAGAGEMTVSDIMIPRTEIVAFSINAKPEELLDSMLKERYTRVPLYEENLDHFVGMIHLKDLVKLLRNQSHDLRKILKPILRVPERKPILSLLGDMQHSFSHLAIVKNAFGVTLGLVTQEDILEEIVGEIRDEFDKEELETIKKTGEDTYEALGRISVLDFNRQTSWNLEAERGDTLSGLVFNLLGRAPQETDEVFSSEYKIVVVGVSGNRITRVRVSKLPTEQEETGS